MFEQLIGLVRKKIAQRHDKSFKTSVRNIASLKAMAKKILSPRLFGLINWEADIDFLNVETIVGEWLKQSFPDGAVVFTLNDGTYLLVVFEHKSYPVTRVEVDTFQNATRLMDLLTRRDAKYAGRTLRMVVVVALQGPAAVTPPPTINEIRGNPQSVSDIECSLGPVAQLDLRSITLMDIGPNPYFETLPMAMGFWKREDVKDDELDCAFRVAITAETEGDIELKTCILNCIASAEFPVQMVKASLSRVLEASRVEGFMTTLAERWVEQGWNGGRTEGRTEGLTEGRTEGRTEGLVSAILSILEERFGVVPKALEKQLEVASPEELDSWVRRAAIAPSVDKVLNCKKSDEDSSSD